MDGYGEGGNEENISKWEGVRKKGGEGLKEEDVGGDDWNGSYCKYENRSPSADVYNLRIKHLILLKSATGFHLDQNAADEIRRTHYQSGVF